ncbi:MAG: hypothetical protein ABI743_11050 [bacterium]
MADIIVTPSGDSSGSGTLAILLVVALIAGLFIAYFNWNSWYPSPMPASSNTEINVTAPPQAPPEKTIIVTPPAQEEPDTNIIITPPAESTDDSGATRP